MDPFIALCSLLLATKLTCSASLSAFIVNLVTAEEEITTARPSGSWRGGESKEEEKIPCRRACPKYPSHRIKHDKQLQNRQD